MPERDEAPVKAAGIRFKSVFVAVPETREDSPDAARAADTFSTTNDDDLT